MYSTLLLYIQHSSNIIILCVMWVNVRACGDREYYRDRGQAAIASAWFFFLCFFFVVVAVFLQRPVYSIIFALFCSFRSLFDRSFISFGLQCSTKCFFWPMFLACFVINVCRYYILYISRIPPAAVISRNEVYKIKLCRRIYIRLGIAW